MLYLETATTMVNSQLLLSQLKAGDHSFVIHSQEDWPGAGAVTNELFNGVTRGARPTNPAMNACVLMDGASGATDNLNDEPIILDYLLLVHHFPRMIQQRTNPVKPMSQHREPTPTSTTATA
uniref:Uncharacterized protein n=1 Tax=Brassica campestris TaxID=3711 RepID=M4DF95_BRACM